MLMGMLAQNYLGLFSDLSYSIIIYKKNV